MPSPARNSQDFRIWSTCVFHQNLDNVGRQGNTAQTLAQWRHPVASSEALDVLYWAMCPTLHYQKPMVIKISPHFFALLILLLPITVANNHVMVIII